MPTNNDDDSLFSSPPPQEGTEVELDDFSDAKLDQNETEIVIKFGTEEEETEKEVNFEQEFKEEHEQVEEEEGLFPLAPITLLEKEENEEPFVVPPWDIKYLAAFIGCFLLLLLVLGVIVAIIYGPSGFGEINALEVLFLIGTPWLVFAGFPIALSHFQGNGALVDFGITFRGKDFAWGAAFGVGCIVLGLLAVFITTMILGEINSSVGKIELAGFAAEFVLLIMVAIGAPIVEEIAFRGFIFYCLAKHRLHIGIIIPLVGILFSLAHWEPQRIFIVFVLGCVLTYARVYTQSLTPCIVAHVVNNTFAVILGLVWESIAKDEETTETARRITRSLLIGY